jgi:hypothetical protein
MKFSSISSSFEGEGEGEGEGGGEKLSFLEGGGEGEKLQRFPLLRGTVATLSKPIF